jgi:hypothetical protein
MTPGCHCAHCRPPGTALTEALQARFGSRDAVLHRLGLDESVMEGEKTMRTRYDARSRDQEEMSEMTPDQRGRDRRGRDQEMMDPEEGEETLEELIQRLSGEDRRMIYDAIKQLMGRGAYDQPSAFPGMPLPGGGMSQSYSGSDWMERQAKDRKRQRFAHDVATASGKSYCDFFPAAKRIGFSGY